MKLASCRWRCRPSCCACLGAATFERLGGTLPVEVDVRLVAATNRDLRAAVTAQSLPRGPVFPAGGASADDSAAARAACPDVPLLARHFLARRADRSEKADARPCRRRRSTRCESYHWPGNVRELENCLERAVILADGDHPAGHLTLAAPDAAASAAVAGAGGNAERLISTTRRLRLLRRSPASSWMERWIKPCAGCSAKSNAAKSRGARRNRGDTIRAARLLRIPRVSARRMDAYGMRERKTSSPLPVALTVDGSERHSLDETLRTPSGN